MANENVAGGNAVGGQETYGVPLVVDGSSVLHQIFRFRWAEWRKLDAAEKAKITGEAQAAFTAMESSGHTALFNLLGHKGDLLLIHFRDSFEALQQAQLRWNQLRLGEYCEPASSYVSVVELSLHDSSLKLYRQMAEQGVAPHSEQWNEVMRETLERQRQAMLPRLEPTIPETRYLCFYPMDRRRGEDKNWYTLSLAERQRQMDEHGTVGRRYAGKVQQVISGSIGFDDWEWAVDLFGNDPVVFKKLIYEMRFDEVSAVYSNFGTFYIGLRCPLASLGGLLDGQAPEFHPKELPHPAGRPAHR
jgi:peroxiredoxin